MSKYLKLEEFTKEDLLKQLEEGKIDTDFLLEYISKRDKVYNKLIDRINELEERHNKALDFIRDEPSLNESEIDELVKILA